MRVYQAPNLLILSRARRPPLPMLDADDREEKSLSDSQKSAEAGSKKELRGKSRKSSLNLARVLSSLDWKKHGRCVHVTLGYWKTWPRTKGELADVKASLVRDLGRHCRCGIWSLEYQTERYEKYGDWVPHFHCLLWLGDDPVERFESWLRKWWPGFSGNTSDHGVHVTSGDQARGTWYLAMHAAKAAQAPPFQVGRWWGYVNREVLLSAQDLHCTGEAEDREAVWWSRLFRRSCRIKVRQQGRCAQGVSWFLPLAIQWKAAAWIRDQIEGERRDRFERPPF